MSYLARDPHPLGWMEADHAGPLQLDSLGAETMPTMAEKIVSARADLRRLRDGWRPSTEDLVGAVGLDDWLPVTNTKTGVPVLLGNAINHPILGSRPIVTSPVLWLSEDRTVARTLSRWYKLGACALPVTEPDASDPEVGP